MFNPLKMICRVQKYKIFWKKMAEKHCDSNLFYYLCNCKGERNWGLVDLIGILIK